MRKVGIVLALAAMVAGIVAVARTDEIEIGAVYPTGGGQGRGGVDEYRGVRLAAELANAGGGVRGARIRLVLAPADSADQAPGAVGRLARDGVPVILGSYGSTVARPAADEAQRRRLVFWETGAVGELSMAALSGDRVFRFAPAGGSLGRAAVSFTREVLLRALRRDPASLRYGVAYVDDVYGRAVGLGAAAELRRSGLRLAGTFSYELPTVSYRALVRRIARARVDVLFVSAYLEDGVALRRETVRQRVPLVASVGTSSSYCMHEFGERLGGSAVGLFASDKPDGHVLDPARLAPEAAQALRWARATFEHRYHHEMTAPALTGFAGAWALFRHVLPDARAFVPEAIARAARAVTVPTGALPNGSGLEFAQPGTRSAAENLRATSVIWEWVAPRTRAVVWPPAFATSPVLPIALS